MLGLSVTAIKNKNKMTDKGSRFGCYSPLKKRPDVPPAEFFKRHTRNRRQTKSMRPSELAVLCYAHFDGRSSLNQQSEKEPQSDVMQRLALPSPFWLSPSAQSLLNQSELAFHRSGKKNLNLDSDDADPDSSRVLGSSTNRSKMGRTP